MQQGDDRYSRNFLCPLFFEGFARRPAERSPEINALLGTLPYLNGGLFLRHQIEEHHGEQIAFPDRAFEGLFGFFEQYLWHLDDRPLRDDPEINPEFFYQDTVYRYCCSSGGRIYWHCLYVIHSVRSTSPAAAYLERN
jgi:hypothetical protein